MREALIRILADKLVVSAANDDREPQIIAEMADEILAGIREMHVIVLRESRKQGCLPTRPRSPALASPPAFLCGRRLSQNLAGRCDE